MGFKDWETPKDFFDRLDEVYNFTYDAAASHGNTLVDDLYSTIEGTFTRNVSGIRTTSPYKISDSTGLEYPWKGERVFCNPPYDKTILQWLAKAPEASSVVYLLPPSVDTKWFHEVKNNSHFSLVFLEKRLKFWRNGKVGSAPRAGNLVVIYHSWL